MAEEFHYDKLVTLQHTYQHTLPPHRIAFSHPRIRSALYPHQCNLVQGMMTHRQKLTHGWLSGQEAIQGKLGIIGDPAGTGKTLSVLAYLASQISILPTVTTELTKHSTSYFFSHEIKRVTDTHTANLVIVPHSLFEQWKEELERHTTLPCVWVQTKRTLKGDETARQIRESRLVITTHKCYKSLQEYANQHRIEWDNLIVDEASSVFFHSSDPPFRFHFLWLVTNDWIPLIMKHPHMSKSTMFFLRDRLSLHPDLERWLLEDITHPYDGSLVSAAFLKEYLPFFHPQRGTLVLRNANEMLSASIHMPPVAYHVLSCKSNLTLNSLASFYLARNREPSIRSIHVPQLFQALGIESHTLNEYVSRQSPTKSALIRRKADDNECVICLEPCEYPTMVNCCYHLYCGKCLLRNTLLNRKCPTCRELLPLSRISCLTPWTAEETVLSRTKMEACLDILQHTEGTFVIYSPFTNIYYELLEKIMPLGRKAERIENNLFSLRKTIRNIQEKKTNIIFLSNVEALRGISLPSMTHLIFFHELSSYESKQLLIHVFQRIGRTQPLTVVHLNSEIPV
jgi:hypothetical protein